MTAAEELVTATIVIIWEKIVLGQWAGEMKKELGEVE